MALIPVLTQVGQNAFLAAQQTGTPVQLTQAAIGSAARAMTGTETGLTTEIGRGPIRSSNLDAVAHRLDIGILLQGADLGVVADTSVREVGLLTATNQLIFYWSTTPGSLGSINASNAFALAWSITLQQIDPGTITVTNLGVPVEMLLETRLHAVELAIAALPVGPLASAASVTALQTQLTALAAAVAYETEIAALTTRLTNDETGLASKAAQVDLTALTTRVTAAEGALTAQAASIAANTANIAANTTAFVDARIRNFFLSQS